MFRGNVSDGNRRPPAADRPPCRLRRAAGLLFIAAWAACGWADSNPELSSAVRRLGANSFAERHEAGDLLIRAGAEALPLLREAALSGAPEVRYRSLQILEEIERQLLDVQVARVLAGEDVSAELPAWGRFASAVGGSEGARTLFVAMLKDSPELIASIGSPRLQDEYDRSVAEGLNSRYSRTPPRVEDLAAVLFAIAQPECIPGSLDAGLLSQHVNGGRFAAALQDKAKGPPLKALLVAWILRDEGGPALFRLRVADKFGLAEGLAPARALLRDPGNGQEPQSALLFISKYGELQDVHAVEQLLDDAQELSSARRRDSEFSTEVRDLALATLWTLAGENPSEHGMPNAAKPNGQLNSGAVGFPDDEARMKAIAEWRGWRKRNMREHLPPDGTAIEGWSL